MVERLRDAEARRAVAVDALAQTDGLIIGSLSEVQRRCGKPSCHCAERPGHRGPAGDAWKGPGRALAPPRAMREDEFMWEQRWE